MSFVHTEGPAVTWLPHTHTHKRARANGGTRPHSSPHTLTVESFLRVRVTSFRRSAAQARLASLTDQTILSTYLVGYLWFV